MTALLDDRAAEPAASAEPKAPPAAKPVSDLRRAFARSRPARIALRTLALFVAATIFGPMVSPYSPFDPATLDLMDAFTPPLSAAASGNWFPLGSDSQGRDMLTTLLIGGRLSLFVAVAATLFSLTVGLGLGLIAGYLGGWADAVIMRAADVQLTFPAILIALLIFGVAQGIVPPNRQEAAAVWVLILAIGISNWAQFARTARGAVRIERGKDYVAASRILGAPSAFILLRHILPNVLGPALVLGAVGLALAVIEEATLSYLGVGVPPTQPSLGALIRMGQRYLFSGEWWIFLFPALALAILALCVNVLGDWLREALNPKSR